MPAYRKPGRGRDKWTVVIWHKGQRHDFVVTGTKADADAFEARKRVEFEANAPGEVRTALRFEDFCVYRYRPHAETHLKASTWKVRTYQIETLTEFFGKVKLTGITTELVERYKTSRLAETPKPRPVTVNNELAVLSAVMTYAKHVGMPVAKPVIKPLPVRGRGRVTFWTEAEVARLYKACRKQPVDILPMVVFVANTGCRKGEALAIEWKNVDLKKRMVNFWPSEEWQPKDNEPREVPIGDALLELLKKLPKRGRYVFPASHGDRYVEWPRRYFDRARKAAKLTGGPHTLRHTYATHFLKAVPDLYLLSKVLGHSHERTTRIYAHLLPDHLAKARNAVNFAPPVQNLVQRRVQKSEEE